MSDERLLDLTRTLIDSVRSGLSWADTLRKASLGKAAQEVSLGAPVHSSLEKLGLFPPIFISLVRAGEESGRIDTFLERYADALEARIEFRRRLKRALIYPVFAMGLAAALLVLFLTKGAPLLLQGLPVPVQLPRLPFSPAVLTAVLSAPVILFLLTPRWLLLRLPGLRYATEEARYHDFAATLGLLLGAGLRPRQVVDILLQQFQSDYPVRRRLARAAPLLVEEGKGFADCLGGSLPAEDRDRMAVAEAAGRLDETLDKIAKSHRERHLHRLKVATTAVQLSATVALAPVCFGLIMALLWPALSALKQPLVLDAAPGGSKPLKLSEPPAPSNAQVSSFNERNAKNIVSFMQEHKAPAGEGEKKKFAAPKLKPMGSMQKGSFKKIEPTSIKSSLD